MLNPSEIFVIILILSLFLEDFASSARLKNWFALYSPTLILGFLILYYTVLGPLQNILLTGEAFANGVDHRQYLLSGWIAVLVYYLFVRVGYAMSGLKSKSYIYSTASVPYSYIYKVGIYLFFTGTLLYLSTLSANSVFSQFNPFDAVDASSSDSSDVVFQSGSFRNYFLYSLNLAIPGVVLMFSSALRQKKGYLLVLISFIVSIALFLTEGFRYRIAILMVSLLVIWLFSIKKKLPIFLIALFISLFIFVSSLIGAIRIYGSGLDLSKVEDFSAAELASGKGLGEDKVFFATAAIVNQTPSIVPYVGISPILNLILFPIPRSLLPEKPDASYVKDSLEKIYGNAAYAQGVAFLNIGEYFLMAGWFSLVTCALITGFFLKKLWLWFCVRSDEPLAQCVYLIHCAFLLMLLSRGYISQVAMLYVFTVLPSLLIYNKLAKRVNFIDYKH